MSSQGGFLGSAGSTWGYDDGIFRTREAFLSAGSSQDAQQKQAAYQAAFQQLAQMQKQILDEQYKRWAEQRIREQVHAITGFVDAEEFVGV